MTENERVTVEIEGPIAVVTLNRGDKLNALDFAMFDALVAAGRRLSREKSVRAVILHGDGRAFCAGLDFAGVGKQPRRMLTSFIRLPWRSTNLFQEVCWVWRELPMPVIAVIHGVCYGGGLQIALAADFRIAAPDADLSVMEAKWGLIPDMTGSVTLTELLPLDLAKRLAMTGEHFDGARALELGLVSEVSDDPLAAARGLADKLAEFSPDAVAATKRVLDAAWHAKPGGALRLERRLQFRLIRGANHKLARKAGAAHALPDYQDRA
jgi:enoyl-CoA hydratase/carnithine racemase